LRPFSLQHRQDHYIIPRRWNPRFLLCHQIEYWFRWW
jgi:hypothetical protein